MPETRAPSIRILLVDDADDMRVLMRALFAERANTEIVGEAEDGRQAVELAAALHPDLVVLDLGLPVLDGLAALPLLRAASPASRVVVLSALPRTARSAAALAAGAAAYVEKSVPTDSLVEEILTGAGLLDLAVCALTRQARGRFAADPRSVAAARHFAARTLAGWHEDTLADTITLLLSELVTNAVIHAESAPDVRLRLLPDRVHVEVADHRPERVHSGRPGSEQTSGRGLVIVESLAMDWGSVPTEDGKVVWFDVARSDGSAAHPATQ